MCDQAQIFRKSDENKEWKQGLRGCKLSCGS